MLIYAVAAAFCFGKQQAGNVNTVNREILCSFNGLGLTVALAESWIPLRHVVWWRGPETEDLPSILKSSEAYDVIESSWHWRSAVVSVTGCSWAPGKMKWWISLGLSFLPVRWGIASISAVHLHLKDELPGGMGFLLQGKCTLPRATKSWWELVPLRLSLIQEIIISSLSRWLTVWREWLSRKLYFFSCWSALLLWRGLGLLLSS